MSKSVPHLTRECKPAAYLGLPHLETIIPPQLIQEVLTQENAWEERERKLNMQAVVSLIIALALYPQCGTREVYRRLLEGVSDGRPDAAEIPTASALCQRRHQLGLSPLRTLFGRCVHPIALPQTRGAFRFGLRLVAVDGTLESLPDSEANRVAFPYHCPQEHARSPFPQARCLVLMECGTHVIFDVQIGSVLQGEERLIPALLTRSLTPGMLLLCDAGITCSQLILQARQQGAHVLGRLSSPTWKQPWMRLHDGSYLVGVDEQGRQKGEPVQMLRVIEYLVKDPHSGQISKPIRLVTTLLDPKQYPLHALIAVYHERWEIEQGLDEVKTHLLLSRRTLRSQSPQGVEQELYGLLLAYYAVRTLMYAAALQAEWDPDAVSFVQTINVLQRSQWRLQRASWWQRPALRQDLLDELREERVPDRRLRFHARVVKRRHSRYRRKSYAHLRVPCLDLSFFDLVLLI